MVDSADDLQAEWFEGRRRVGLTAGASAPDILVQQVIERLRELGAVCGAQAWPASRRPCTSRCREGLGDRSMAGLPTDPRRPRPTCGAHRTDGPIAETHPCSTSPCCAATWTRVVARLETRKNPQPFLDVARFTRAGGRAQDASRPAPKSCRPSATR